LCSKYLFYNVAVWRHYFFISLIYENFWCMILVLLLKGFVI